MKLDAKKEKKRKAVHVMRECLAAVTGLLGTEVIWDIVSFLGSQNGKEDTRYIYCQSVVNGFVCTDAKLILMCIECIPVWVAIQWI